MRLLLRIIAIVTLGCLGMTTLLLLLPQNHVLSEQESHVNSEMEKFPPVSVKGNLSKTLTDAATVVEKLQKSNPWKLTATPTPPNQEDYNRQSDDYFDDFMVASGRTIDWKLVQRLERYLQDYHEHASEEPECGENTTIGEYWPTAHKHEFPLEDAWDKFFAQIGSCDMYREGQEKALNELLQQMTTLPVKDVDIMDGGTQVKLLITFENEKQALFKPMRFGRQHETGKDQFYFTDFERHTAEIAAFHLDRAPWGSIFSVYLGHDDLLVWGTIMVGASNGGNMVNLSVVWSTAKTANVSARFNLSSNVFQKDWQATSRLAEKQFFLRSQSQDNGNQDRHHYHVWSMFEGYPLYMDNGRGFGRSDIDDLDILRPLIQCCAIRPSFLHTLLRYYFGPETLSEAFHKSLLRDPVAPILALKHFPAIERRLQLVLIAVDKCVARAGNNALNVIMNAYHNPDVKPTGTDDSEHKTTHSHHHRIHTRVS